MTVAEPAAVAVVAGCGFICGCQSHAHLYVGKAPTTGRTGYIHLAVAAGSWQANARSWELVRQGRSE